MFGAEDVSDARRAVEVTLGELQRTFGDVYGNEAGHLEFQYTARASHALNKAFGAPLGKAFGRNYAFIALERIGGVMVYDIPTPAAPQFVEYVNNRDFTVPVALDGAGDLGAEGMTFIKADDSPSGSALLVVANEVSGTTTIFEVAKTP